MKDDDSRNLDAVLPEETAASAAAAGPIPAPIPGGNALADPSLASFAATDAATGTGLGGLLQETFVRATLSPEENELTRDHHVGHEITGRLDEAVDAPDHSVLREEVHAPARGR